MAKGSIIAICQSGGKFTTGSDGSLSYTGGDAHAIGVSHETKFNELKSEMAEMWKYAPNAMAIKYFLPNNKKTLITISSNKDIKRMIDFHKDSGTVDVYVTIDENPTNNVSPVPCSRSSRTTVAESVTPLFNLFPVSSVSGDSGQLNTSTPVTFGDGNGNTEQPNFLVDGNTGQPNILVDGNTGQPNILVDGNIGQPNILVDGNIGQPNFLAPVGSDVGDAAQQKLYKSWKNSITGVHQKFKNVHEFRDALRKYATSHGFTYTFKKNECTRVTAKCKGEGCPWRVHASRVPTTQLFQIKTMNATHTCRTGTELANPRSASRKLVACIVKEKLLETPNSKPRDIAEQIHRNFGIELKYSQAWRGIETAREELQGSCKASYNRLPWLCQKIVETNPGSVVTLITREDLSFHRLFVAFHASLCGFQNGCRPLIFLDTLTLKSKYQSELLTATALDGDDGIFPVAFAVVDVLNDDNWHWFLLQLKSALSACQPITFVADRDKGLRQSIFTVFETSYHAYCLHHLIEEFKKDLQGSCTEDDVNVIITHLYDASHAGTIDGFRKSIGNIRQISSHACEWILLSEPEHWANALFEGSRYNHTSSAIAESFYSWVTELPVLPVVQIIDTVRRKVMELIYNRRMDSNRWLTRLTPSLEEKLQKEILKAPSLQVQLGLNSAFEVCDGLGVVNVVNIDLGKCSCGDWQLNGYPCFHAVAVLQRMGEDLYNYCSKYYTTETFRSTYTESINPLPPVDKQPVDIESEQILPPPLRRASGPPKKRRIRSKGPKRPLRCSKCNGVGHNRATCHVYA
ncbi:hypothetical protein EZV62_010205 [Acer yangbiense]|uniref:SWIM-type domain-containing protein n=1 Tax=Acer yangbiense TaxID=1000413 RepID=A0A5C7I1N8_9ROSI|nr:hypothetical protein EZV62_010205 [Acer yangbiense]